jgi:hypothetical protein
MLDCRIENVDERRRHRAAAWCGSSRDLKANAIALDDDRLASLGVIQHVSEPRPCLGD